MGYARLDDLYDDKLKIKRAWRTAPEAIGLHAMAITYCTRHRTDGTVPLEWIEEIIPRRQARERVLNVLVECRLFDVDDTGAYSVHDYLDWNESAEVRSKRSKAAKAAAGKRWKDADSNA